MPQKQHTIHGRDHLPTGADPIPGLLTGNTGTEVVYSDYVLSFPSLIGYWRLGETGEPWVDSTADDNDMELEDHGVALTANVTGALPAGQDDGAIQLNYTGSTFEGGDYLTTGAPSPSNALFQLGSMTVAGFVKVSAYPASRGLVAGSVGWTGSHWSGWAIWVLTSGEIIFAHHTYSGTEEYAASPAPVVLDEWYHVAGTYDFGTGDIKLYLNGSLVETTAATVGLTSGVTDGIIVGQQLAGSTANYYTGSLDELAVWNVALTAIEIATLASASTSTLVDAGKVLTADGDGGSSWEFVDAPTSIVPGTDGYWLKTESGAVVWAELEAGGEPADDTEVWMPLTTVTGGVPELVWDANDDLIPTLVGI